MINERGISEIHAEDIEAGVIYRENILIDTDTMMAGIAFLKRKEKRGGTDFLYWYHKEMIVAIMIVCVIAIIILRLY
jgi:hypothetical protein